MGLPLTKPRRSEPWTEFSAIQVIKPLTTYCDELRVEEGLTGGPRSPRNTRREQQQGSSRRAGISSRRTCAAQANRNVLCMRNYWGTGRFCSAGNDQCPILALLLAWGIGLGESSERAETLAGEALSSPDMDKPVSRPTTSFCQAMLADIRNLAQGRPCAGSWISLVL